MTIAPDKYVSIHYKLTLDDGEVADSTEGGNPLGFVYGSGQLISGLEKALEGKKAGDKFTVTIAPEEAYGERSEEMHRELPRENFPEGLSLEPGMGFTAEGPHGPVSFFVVSADDEVVVADFNHPLAGRTLTFDVEVAEVTELGEDELKLMKGEGGESGCGSSCGGGCSADSCGSSGCGCY